MNDQLMDALRATRRVSDEQVTAVIDGQALASLRDGIVMSDRRDGELLVEVPRRGWRLGRRRLIAGGAAAALAVTGAATAYAVFANHAETAGIGCHLEPDAISIISPVSADPVADCTAAATRAGEAVPDGLAAYQADGRIVVAPPSLAPKGGTPLPAGPVQDPDVIKLAAALQDEVDSPAGAARCGTGQAWAEYAEAEIARIGLDGWSVTGDTASPDCAYAFPDAATRRIMIKAREGVEGTQGAPAQSPHSDAAHPNAHDLANLRTTLRSRISQDCVTLDQAEQIVRTAVRDNHFNADEGLDITRFPDPDAHCARVDLVVGGALDVRLYGR